jgi:hypothetical protein
MDGSTHWHRGDPPQGWQRAEDGRWRPPADVPTVEMVAAEVDTAVADDGWRSPGAAHLAAAGRPAGGPTHRRPALRVAAVLVAAGALVAAALLGGADGEVAVVPPTWTVTTGRPGTTPTPTPPVGPSPAARTGGREGADDGLPTPTSDAPAPEATATSEPAPAPTAPPAPTAVDALRPGGQCSPDGATATSDDGVVLTCTRQRCEGPPFVSPHWTRREC